MQPALIVFQDGTSMIHELGIESALKSIKSSPIQKHVEADFATLQGFKETYDKMYELTKDDDCNGNPSHLDRAIAELKHPKPCVITFVDKSAALQPFGREYAEAYLAGQGKEWIGHYSCQEYEEYVVAKDICRVHNQRCNKEDTMALKVMTEVFDQHQ